jgi:threonylcarbamoyladenosine tRNA methylthiotransferase MtaB
MVSQNNTRVALDTLGCKLNQAEMELLARQLVEAGYRLVSADDEADIYILNTCTVTHIADRKARQRLRLARRRNPDALIIAMGCYAQRSPQELAQLNGVKLVLGNEDKMHLVSILEQLGYPSHPTPLQSSDGTRSRAFIKVQDGCNNLCTYCIVPLVRGREKSLPSDHLISEVIARVADDYREVVLTGTEIGSYRHSGLNLTGLIEGILSQTGVERLRLSSLQPQEITEKFISLWQDPRLCPHFHLPLQSGSDGVLLRMRRRYSTDDFRRAVELIRKTVPDAAITTDVIVGFPGESEEEFEESLSFCKKMDFARIHVFPYSPRPGTEAARMPGQVSSKVKRQRSERMLALARESAAGFRQRFLGRTMPVLWEQKTNGTWSGLTGNYIRVYTKSDEDLSNKILPVKLERLCRDGVGGIDNSSLLFK